MKFQGSRDQLVELVNAISPVETVEQPQRLCTRIRTRDGVVVNWSERKQQLDLQGRRDPVEALRAQLLHKLERVKSTALSSHQAVDDNAVSADKNAPKHSAVEAIDSLPKKQYSYRAVKPEANVPTYTMEKDSELVIALVGAVGTDLSAITTVLRDRLKTFSYETTEIKISSDIIAELRTVPQNPYFDRVNALMTEGNALRKDTSDNAVLAKLAAAKINEIRVRSRPADKQDTPLSPLPRRAFIIPRCQNSCRVT